ncbi:sialidase family protein [Aureliella helgolandensis]|uniref:BNR/Asp-box repeat protein n=1 Tax=Aureliella helgolandensis TaxID=2527968 RepID=A0A518GGV3_9BACT|nr:sialidase family protein [Aureliella helgolandensis]QDV27813.1 BNR/Asp-box repeat protein [Aureliella helgolandensis]
METAAGDLIVSWYRGSGERTADDVAVYGSRLRAGESEWSDAFLMADYPGFPDCNTAMMIDDREQLWLFWPTILANSWESCLTNYRVSRNFQEDGTPSWEEQGLILLKPDDLAPATLKLLADVTVKLKPVLSERLLAEIEEARERIHNKLYQRLGWQPRCKPTVLPSGRILLPLYTDTFSISIMAISDDGGRTWYASGPLVGLGNIQPAVLRRDDGVLVAYMRDNGPLNRVAVCESQDEGLTWGPVVASDLLNPGSGLDGVRLRNGHWLLVYNDQLNGRNRLAVSEDEGGSWSATRYLENHESGSYHYPAVIQGQDGRVHVVYSYFVEGGKSMKHVAFSESWIHQTGK